MGIFSQKMAKRKEMTSKLKEAGFKNTFLIRTSKGKALLKAADNDIRVQRYGRITTKGKILRETKEMEGKGIAERTIIEYKRLTPKQRVKERGELVMRHGLFSPEQSYETLEKNFGKKAAKDIFNASGAMNFGAEYDKIMSNLPGDVIRAGGSKKYLKQQGEEQKKVEKARRKKGIAGWLS